MERIRLLVVEDEPALLSLLQRFLERAGYEVEPHAAPEPALARYRAEPAGFGVVITDLTLGGMDGEHLLREIRELNPSQPAILTSGFAYSPPAGVLFLQKPFLPAMLIESVQQALANRG